LRGEVLVVLGRHHVEGADGEGLALPLGAALKIGAVRGLLGGLLGDVREVHLDTGEAGEGPGGNGVDLGVHGVGDVVERYGEVGRQLQKDLLILSGKIHNVGRDAGLGAEEPVAGVLGVVVLDKGVSEHGHKVLDAVRELVVSKVAPIEVVEEVIIAALGGNGRGVTKSVHLGKGVGLGDEAGGVGTHSLKSGVEVGIVVRISRGRPRSRVGRVGLGRHHGLHRRVDGGVDGSRVGEKHSGSNFLETNVQALVAKIRNTGHYLYLLYDKIIKISC